MTRRAKGEGHITQRKNGTYQINIIQQGVQKSFYGKTRQEVYAKLRKFQFECDQGITVTDITVSEHTEWWLQSVKKDRIKPGSYDRLERTYLLYIKEEIGDVPLKKLTSSSCQELINKWAERYAYSTVKKIYELLNASLEYALNLGHISKNPMTLVSMQREASFKKKTKEIVIPTEESVKKFFEAAECTLPSGRSLYTKSYVKAFRIISQTGLRLGEMLALKWDNVSFENGTIRIDSSVSEVIDREAEPGQRIKHVITEPKTKSGYRTIQVSDSTLNTLRELREMYKAQGFDTDGFVILNSKGLPANGHSVERTLNSICKAAGIESFTPHVFRHYFASWCVANGVDFVKLASHLGHSRPSITMNIYSHVTLKQNEEFKKLLNSI